MFLRGFFCAAASAQEKIGLIDTDAFHDKQTGIREIVELDEKLNVEFKPQIDELGALAAKFQKLEKDLKELRELMSCKACKFPPEIIKEYERKIEEYDKLIDEYKLKENVAEEHYYKRKAAVFTAVDKKVAEALRRFIKENGYAMIFDLSKLKENPLIFEKTWEGSDATEEFIRFYNENFAKTN